MWIELHDSSRDHPKILKLARDLGIKPVQALGHMASLWTWTLRMAPDGDLSSFDDDDVEIGAQWEGERGKFVASALDRTLLERESDGSLVLHDWQDYAAHLKAAKRKREERQRKKKQGPGAVVYFAWVGPDCIKIGHSENVIRRMAEHAYNHEGEQPRPIGIIKGTQADEKAIRDRFKHLKRGRFEFFDSAPELLDFIAGHVTPVNESWNPVAGHVTLPEITPGHVDRPTDRPTDQTDRPKQPEKVALTTFPKLPDDLPPLPGSSSAADEVNDHGVWFGKDQKHACRECSKELEIGDKYSIEYTPGFFCEDCFNAHQKPSESFSWPLKTINAVATYVANEQHWQAQLSPKNVIIATQLLDDKPVTKAEADYAASQVNEKPKGRQRNAGLFLSIIDQERVKVAALPEPGTEHAEQEAKRRKKKKNAKKQPPKPQPDLTPTEAQWRENQRKMKELTSKLVAGMKT